jgi:hypothetical protein
MVVSGYGAMRRMPPPFVVGAGVVASRLALEIIIASTRDLYH